MEFSTKVGKPTAVRTDALAVGMWSDGTLTGAAQDVDTASKGALRAAVAAGDASGKRATALLLRGVPGVTAARVLLVGLGKRDEFNDKAYADAVRSALRAAGGARDIVLATGEWDARGRDAAWGARQLVLAARDLVFRTDELKSRKDPAATVPERIALLVPARAVALERALAVGTAMANGADLAKRLGNLPGNVCTPSFLGDQAKRMAKEFDLEVEVLETKQIEALKMGSFLSVTRGSAQPPRLIVLRYKGAGKAAPITLVGKGITFDSGGISLKPGAAMDEMKYDMGGAAAVFGTLRAIGELRPKINVIGIVAACENMPSGTATKPGDIVTSMSGLTIEVLNTDAEGRLILCDALTYAERFKPAAVIDIATLTGACVVALGDVNSGLFATDDALADALTAAARATGDLAWRLPLDDDYQEQIKSNFADLANIGPPGKAGAVLAACFLARFTKGYKWAHLDVAGTAWRSGGAKGATGRPVPLLTDYLLGQAG